MEDNENITQTEQAAEETAEQPQEQAEGAPASEEQSQEQTEQPVAAPDAEEEQPPAPKRDKDSESEVARRAQQAEVEKARQEARVQAIVDAVGTNPWTDKPIKDAADVEEYLLMRQIDRDGKDPIADYPEYVKRQKAEEERAAAKARGDRETARKEVEEFRLAFPDVDLQELAKDTDFDDFARGAIGNEPLVSIYRRYTAFCERVAGDAAKKAQQRAVAEKAKANAAVGSLSNESDQHEGEFYTLEQIKGMSQEDVSKNWEKVKKSMQRLNKNQ